jgi:hypothetical protein
MFSPRQTVHQQTPPKQPTPAAIQTPAPGPSLAPNPVAPPAAIDQPAAPTTVVPAENPPAAPATPPPKHKAKQHGQKATDSEGAPQRQAATSAPSASAQKKQNIKKKLDKVENAVKKFFRGL